MFRILTPVLPLMASPALAHEGLHHHPHGIEWGWVVAVLVAIVGVGGVVYARVRK